ncbi:extracellular solute-binding protein [Eisenbergiella porci]|uniref:extracellular solute-binding protein n=1 Tax=Eisenbergiella porci TaxID=2652274 RepID=UPI002A819BBB|nr:extracellular solute-binding protein [Eisenbergiella porci]
MKKRRTALVLILCLVMASLAGCGKSAAQDDIKVEGPKSEEEKMKKYDPEITLTFAKAEVVTNYPEGQDAQKNDMYKMWEDIMGIKVENSILCASNAMTEKFQLAIASDEIPDFGIVDAATLASLIKNDMVMDMTDIYDQWATDNLKAIAGQQDNALFAPTLKDGRYMAIPVANTVGDSYPILWIRSDWLDALGLKAPSTMEEVFAIAEKFAADDPDGNGKDDTYGLYLDKDLNGLDFIMAAYEVYSKDEYWVKQEDGSFIAGCTDPDAKKPLGALAKLYEAGAIDHEFAVKEQSKEEELIASGKIGIYIGYFYSPLGVMKDSVANVGADWIAVPMPAAEGYPEYKPGVNLNVYGYIYAKQGITNPEAIVVMLNHLCDGYAAPWLSDGDSEFYKKYNELAADSAISQAGANNLMPFQMAGNINWGKEFTEAIAAGKEHVEGKDADYQNVISTGLSEDLSWAWKKVYLEGYLVMDLDNVRYSDYTGAPTETMSKTQSLLNTQKLTDYISIIMGDQPVDYFDTFVETFNNIGGAKIAEEIKEELQ